MPAATNAAINEDVDQLLGSYDAGVREIALRARDLITGLVPKSKEKVYFGWRIIGFSLDGKMSGQFLSVGPGRNYVNLYFMQGTTVDDPKGLLEGTGKNMRHVKLREVADLKKAALKDLIKAAAELQRQKLQQTTPTK